MAHDAHLGIAGLGLWLPGVVGCEAWRSGARAPAKPGEFEAPQGHAIEKRARRRASLLSRALADAHAEAAMQAGLAVDHVATVFGSALGEVSVMLGLLSELWKGEAMSPMAFATSVHSSASGVVSISSKNRGFTTAIAANEDTPGAALLEAKGVALTMGYPVIVVCGDEASPRAFLPDDRAFDMAAVAIAVCPPGWDGPVIARLRGPFVEPSVPVAPFDGPDTVARNPQAGLLDLVRAVLDGRRGLCRLDRGLGLGWCVEVLPT